MCCIWYPEYKAPVTRQMSLNIGSLLEIILHFSHSLSLFGCRVNNHVFFHTANYSTRTLCTVENEVRLNHRAVINLTDITNIKDLNPYNTNATIKARVASKSAMRAYTNAKGEGKFFSIELVDSTGEIKCTMFNEMADQYDNVFQVHNDCTTH
jgi:hypothetical protein